MNYGNPRMDALRTRCEGSFMQNILTHQIRKVKSMTKLAFAVAAAWWTASAFAGPGPGNWPAGFPTVVKSKEQAMACCLPKENLALACKDCKTVTEKPGEKKKGIAAWFAIDKTHGCSGCSGKITVRQPVRSKQTPTSIYTHVCTKCGENSAYTCATHKT